MKKYNTEKMKRIHIYPVIIAWIFVVFIVGVAITLISETIISNMTKGKISQGYKWAEGCYNQIKDIDVGDTSAMSDTFENYTKVVKDVTGVTILDGENIIYTIGNQISNKKTNVNESLPFIEEYDKKNSNCEVFLDAGENSGYKKLVSGNWRFIFKTIKKSHEELEGMDAYEAENKPVISQLCYYGFKNDNGTVTYITSKIHITTQDVFVMLMVCISLFLICVIYFVFVVFMISKFVKNQRRLLKLYYADKETGGRNWYYFLEKASKKMKRFRYKSAKVAMVHIRMEKYRSYCSCYGDREGQMLVSDFYDVIRNNLKRKEIFARHEICDFGILLHYESEEQLVGRVKYLMHLMADKRPNIKLYFKAGINILGKEKIEPSEAYNRAAMARREIGNSNDKNVNFFTQQMKEELLWERKVENDMERALREHEYKVYLQPKYSVDKEKLVAAEALVRWVHSTEGLIAPYKFIPIFEKNGFITKLDDYMIAEVAKLQAGWIAQGKKIVPISVNVSRAHFTRENLAEHICEIVDSYKVPHEAIELELTESAFFDDKKTLIGIVNKMKSYGFAVSMDDFGAGYSSLNSLKELPIDVVKLDAEFFRGEDEEGKGKVIVSEAINLAKKLNLRIVAEGIETREQVDFLAENECDLIQGYFFAKPMPVDEFEERVERDGEKEIIKESVYEGV